MADMKTDLLIITALESELKRNVLPTGVEIVYSGLGKINPQLDGLLHIGKVIQRDMMAEPLAPRGKTPFCERPFEYLSSGKYVCGSGDSFVTASDPWLLSQGVDLVDMELFAIAYVANHHQIPWHSYKYITDDANESSGNDWHEKVNHGQDLFIEKLRQLLS